VSKDDGRQGGRGAGGRGADVKGTDAKGAEGKGAGGRGADVKGTDAKGAEGRGAGGRGADGASSVAALHRRIKEQLATTDQVVTALKEQLATCRQRNRELVEERNDLIKSMARPETRQGLPGSGGRRPSSALTDAAAAELRALQQENEQLKRRCAELEEAVLDWRRQNVEAAQEVECLEEQVAHLQSTVDLLSEHLEVKAPPALMEPRGSGSGDGENPVGR
jgi:hypothetical protein